MLRLIRGIGTRESLRAFWGHDCPNCINSGRSGFHNAERKLRDIPGEIATWDAENKCFTGLGGREVRKSDYADLPPKCDWCPATIPEDAPWRLERHELFDNPEGEPQPNDCFTIEYGPGHYCDWDDCDGKHFIIVLPDRPTFNRWDTTHRASNCSAPQDRRHRCWVIVGDPPRVSSVVTDRKCSGGKCSIETPYFHKTIKDGEWVD